MMTTSLEEIEVFLLKRRLGTTLPTEKDCVETAIGLTVFLYRLLPHSCLILVKRGRFEEISGIPLLN
jgi:hypothetical protein